jgi:uncharacterized C2H2 Zn-finger protein
MILSIRNVSRFGSPVVALAWLAAFIGIVGNIGLRALGVVFPIVWIGGGAATMMLFRCPRCHGSTTSVAGSRFAPTYAPIWTPPSCPRCHLDFRDKTFWSPGNRKLRADWLLLTGRRMKPRPR